MENYKKRDIKKENKIHGEKARYLHEKWTECKRKYDEQVKTGKDYGIYYFPTKSRHPNFDDLKPLDLKKYLRDWQIENIE